MLILSRKVGEEIVIDGNIRVVVNRVAGDRVTLAFKAPNEIKILRAELEPHVSPSNSLTNPILPPAPVLPTGPRFETGPNRLPLRRQAH